MKKILLFLFASSLVLLQACDKDDPALKDVDLSNTIQPYLEFNSTEDRTVKQGTQASLTVQMRTGLQQPVTVHYDVTGAVNLPNQTLVLEKEKTSGAIIVSIPANVVVPPATSATAVVTLKRAVRQDGTELTLGSKNMPGTQKVTLLIQP
jgi:uncharacterized protein YcfL